jgi:hypothetical protein
MEIRRIVPIAICTLLELLRAGGSFAARIVVLSDRVAELDPPAVSVTLPGVRVALPYIGIVP